jgi:hypothetical protein
MALSSVDVVRGQQRGKRETKHLDQPQQADHRVGSAEAVKKDRQNGLRVEQCPSAPERSPLSYQDREVPPKVAGGEIRRPLSLVA